MRQQFTEKELVDLTLAIIDINGWNRMEKSVRPVPGTYQSHMVRSLEQAL